MSCQNCNHGFSIVKSVELEPSEFVSIRESYIRDRKGVAGYKWRVNQSGNLVEVIYTLPSEYETENYFKYRREYEERDGVEVEDVGTRTVEITYNCQLLGHIEVCDNCGSRRHHILDDLDNKNLHDVGSEPFVIATHF